MVRLLPLVLLTLATSAPAAFSQSCTGFDDFLKRYEAAEPPARAEVAAIEKR